MNRKIVSFLLLTLSFLLATFVNAAEATTVQDVLKSIANNLVNIALAAALVGIIFGGFYFITAGGDEARLKTGRGIMLWSIVGAIIVLISKTLANIAAQATGREPI